MQVSNLFSDNYLSVPKLSDEKTLFEIIKDNKKLPSGKLFQKYRRISNEGISDRLFRYRMNRIKELGLVMESGSTKGRAYESMI